MEAKTVIELLKVFAENDIDTVVDGGWGVDALLGRQTRPHEDLDIAIPHKDVLKIRKLLTDRGFNDAPRDDTRDCNFVLGDSLGNSVDVHSYKFDEQGNNIFGVAYLPEYFTGTGTIDGYPVKCISAEWTVKFHVGYELDDNDFSDILAVCQHFNIPLPKEYDKFMNQNEQKG